MADFAQVVQGPVSTLGWWFAAPMPDPDRGVTPDRCPCGAPHAAMING